MRALEKWLLNYDGIPIMYRNKTNRQLHKYIFVKCEGALKMIKDLYDEYNTTNSQKFFYVTAIYS